MTETITAMHARKNFGHLLNETSLLEKSFIIERAGKPMAALVPLNSSESAGVAPAEVEKALETLIKRIKGPQSKKLEKAIDQARISVSKLSI